MRLRFAGFTLIEILVVLFIVSIMTGIAIAKLPSLERSADIDTESRRLKAVLDLAREEALLQANELGFRAEPDRYQFFLYDDLKLSWSEITERPFQAHQLEQGLELRLKVEDDELKLGEDEEQKAPPVLLLSSGETTPFELTISKPAEHIAMTLVADGFSDLKWAADEDE